MRSPFIPFALTAVCTAAGAAEAAPPLDLASRSIEELMQMEVATVSSASKFDQKVTRAPSSVTLVTAEDIARFGYRTLADALRSVRGVYIADDRNYSYLGVRGFLRPGDYNSRILLLVDGHRMNDNLYDGAYFGRDGLPSLENVERIEFVRGPSSSIYGSSAFFGIVNVVTRQAGAPEGARLTVGTGSYGTRESSFSADHTSPGGTSVNLSGSYYHSDGPGRLYYPELDPAVSSDPRASDGGWASNRDGEQSKGLTATLQKPDFKLTAFWLQRTKDVPTASFGTLFDADENTRDARAYLDAQYSYDFARGAKMNARLSLDRYQYDGEYPMAGADGLLSEPEISRDHSRGTWVSSEWQLNYTLSNGNTILAGVDARHSLAQEQQNYLDVAPRVVSLDDRRNETNVGVYMQGEFTLAPKILLNAGVRYDEYLDSFGGTLNPRVGLIVNVAPTTALKMLYGSAFRAPSVYERFYYPARQDGGLDPERIRTYEVVLEHYRNQADRLELSAYQYSVRGLISQQADAADEVFFANATQVLARGMDLEMERELTSGALARLSYSIQEVQDVRSGRDLTSSPHHLAKFHGYLPLRSGFGTAVEVQYQSSALTLSEDDAGGFALANWHLSRSFSAGRFTLFGSVLNVFDHRYGYPAAEDHVQNVIGLNGRTFSLRATASF